MKSIDNILNAILSNFYNITPWFLRLGLGISFILHGLGKFPLPPQKLIDYFGFSSELASFVAISELGAGILLILGGFLKGTYWQFSHSFCCSCDCNCDGFCFHIGSW
jgi:hypothetical protein